MNIYIICDFEYIQNIKEGIHLNFQSLESIDMLLHEKQSSEIDDVKVKLTSLIQRTTVVNKKADFKLKLVLKLFILTSVI